MTMFERLLVAVVGAGLLWPGCGRADSQGDRGIDLGALLGQAERRPAGASFDLSDVTLGGQTRRALLVPTTSRIIWQVEVPNGATLQTGAAFPVDGWLDGTGEALFRVGVSDARVYEELLQTRVAAGLPSTRRWTPIAVDLSRYGGVKWSLFYQPGGKRWKVILNTGVAKRGTPGARPDRLLWMTPAIIAR